MNRKQGIIIGLVIAVLLITAYSLVMSYNTTSIHEWDTSVSIGAWTLDSQSDDTTLGIVTLGSLLPITGDLSTHGKESMVSIELAINDFNQYLKESNQDWSLKVVNEDSATNPVVALEKLTALHSRGIDLIIGPESSAELNHVQRYANLNNILLVSPSSTAPELAIPEDNIYRLIADDTKQGPAIARMIQDAGIEVLVPVWRGDTWGDGVHKATIASLPTDVIIHEGIRYHPESVEFSASASLLSKTIQMYVDEYGTDKVGVLIVSFAEIVPFVQSASAYDILDDVRWFGSDGNTNEDKLIQDPIALEFSQNVSFSATQTATNKNQTYLKVDDHINKVLGRSPNSYAFSAYDTVWLIGLAINQTQSTDIDTIKSVIPSIADTHQGAIGSIRLNEAGDLAQADYDVWSIINDKWMHVGTYISTTDSIIDP